MATIQSQIDQMAGSGFSVSNLALNAAGVAKMAMGKKDVYITLAGKDTPYELLVADNPQKLGFASDYLGLNSVIMYADVIDTSELCEHPLESGAKIVDHQIQRPVEIKLQIVLPYYLYKEVYEELQKLKEEGTFVTVHTKAATYTRMIFKDIPHKENADNISRLVFDCTLRQGFLVTGIEAKLNVEDVKKVANATTKNVGQKSGQMVGQSFLSSIRTSVQNVISQWRQ